MLDYDTQICSELLKREYAKAVSARTGKTMLVRWLVKPDMNVFIDAIAEELKDCRLAKLFIEAQFSVFPEEWCMQKTRKPFPMPNMVFRGNCFGRYLEYITEGVREPI